MLKLFKTLSISAKIAAGSVGMVLLAVVLAAAGWYGVQTLGAKIESSKGLSHTLAQMNEAIRTKALYIADPSDEAAQDVRQRLDAIKATLLSAQDAQSNDRFNVARNAVKQFSASFSELRDAVNEIELRDAEIAEARADIREMGEALALDARLEEDSNRNALRDQRGLTKRANDLAFEVSEVVIHAQRARLSLPAYLSGGDTTAMDQLKAVQATTGKLFISNVSPEVDAAVAKLHEQTEKTLTVLSNMQGGASSDFRAATASLQSIINDAKALKEAFFAFIRQSTDEQQAIEKQAIKTRSKAHIGQQFYRAAIDVASDLNDYRAEPSREEYEAITQHIAKLKGLNGAVKAMTDRDATETIETLTQAFKGLRNAKRALRQALDVASENESLASNVLNDVVTENAVRADRVADQATMTIFGASLISLVFAVMLTFGLWYLISRPLKAFTETTLRLANGEHGDVDLNARGRKDEIGQLIEAMAVFRDNLIENERLQAQQRQAQRAQSQRQQAVDRLIQDFRMEMQDVLQVVGQNVEELQSTAHEMTTLAEGSASRSAEVTNASQDASSNVQAVATAAEELASSIEEISRQASVAMDSVSNAAGTASMANDKISRLAEAAQTIGEVISMISDIANQTNLLALNATIEAARAGEAGKGFAVVASEVKSLATQTTQATERIASQIAGIQSETGEAVQAIGTITTTMDEVNRYTNAIAIAVSQQGDATGDISRNVLQAADRTRSVADTISEVSESSTQTKNAADQVLKVSSNVRDKAAALKSRVDRFLDAVAAA